LIDACLKLLEKLIKPVDFKQWFELSLTCSTKTKFRLQRAGHILGSAYVEIDIIKPGESKRIVFSGDLGAPYIPLITIAKTSL